MAMAEHQERSRWTQQAAVVTACGLLLVGIVAGVALKRAGNSEPKGIAATTSKALVRVGSQPWTAARLDGSGQQLVVYFTGGGPPDAPISPCSPRYQGRAAVTGTTMTVTVDALARAPLPSQVICGAVGYERSVAVGLPEPLGGRSVVDGATGKVRPVVDGSALRQPSSLPAGYRFARDRIEFDADRVAFYEREWVKAARSEEVLLVDQGGPALDRRFDGRVVLATASIHGAAATAWKAKGFDDVVCVSWVEGTTGLRVCNRGSPAAPLPVAELLRVAAGLR
jgi:hypothetical protein